MILFNQVASPKRKNGMSIKQTAKIIKKIQWTYVVHI